MFLTFGHGTATQEQLTALLSDAGVRRLVDVRRFPGSRRHPYVAGLELEKWLPQAGIEYRWEPRLGGRRRVPPHEAGADPWWRVEAFRAYAAHTRTEEFGAGMVDLLTEVTGSRPDSPVTIMCSESLWWRCHRRLIADVGVLLHGITVQHLMHDGTRTEHTPAAGARVAAGKLFYDKDL